MNFLFQFVAETDVTCFSEEQKKVKNWTCKWLKEKPFPPNIFVMNINKIYLGDSVPAKLQFKMSTLWTSLVAQWLGILLPMQGSQVWFLVWEDSTGRRAAKPTCHHYWVCALEPMLCNEKPVQWEACTPQLDSSPCSLHLDNACTRQWRPSAAKNKWNEHTLIHFTICLLILNFSKRENAITVLSRSYSPRLIYNAVLISEMTIPFSKFSGHIWSLMSHFFPPTCSLISNPFGFALKIYPGPAHFCHIHIYYSGWGS